MVSNCYHIIVKALILYIITNNGCYGYFNFPMNNANTTEQNAKFSSQNFLKLFCRFKFFYIHQM